MRIPAPPAGLFTCEAPAHHSVTVMTIARFGYGLLLLVICGSGLPAVFDSCCLRCLLQKAPPLVARWVPFAAVASANCVNIPMMRQQ